MWGGSFTSILKEITIKKQKPSDLISEKETELFLIFSKEFYPSILHCGVAVLQAFVSSTWNHNQKQKPSDLICKWDWTVPYFQQRILPFYFTLWGGSFTSICFIYLKSQPKAKTKWSDLQMRLNCSLFSAKNSTLLFYTVGWQFYKHLFHLLEITIKSKNQVRLNCSLFSAKNSTLLFYTVGWQFYKHLFHLLEITIKSKNQVRLNCSLFSAKNSTLLFYTVGWQFYKHLFHLLQKSQSKAKTKWDWTVPYFQQRILPFYFLSFWFSQFQILPPILFQLTQTK